MNIPHDAHVLVIDGRKMLLFKNAGGAVVPRLDLVTLREQDSAPTQAQGSDRPGRTHASVGGSHSSYEQTDFHRMDEDAFAARAANLLNREVLDGQVRSLIVVAAPRTLGALRKNYHADVKAALLGEIAKDIAGHTTDDILSVIAAA
jgi:protein required for attachment to host cells